MMKLVWPIVLLSLLCGCSSVKKDMESSEVKNLATKPLVLEEIVSFKGQQVTGVTASADGRLFACFPRWRKNVENSVVEILPDGKTIPYPNESWNKYSGRPEKNKFTSIQSVFAHNSSLYVLDPSSPLREGVIGRPMLYEFDLKTNKLKRSWIFEEAIAPEKSYLSDLRVDEEANKIYITDSGMGAIVVLDLKTGKTWRVLDKHKSTNAETVVLKNEGKIFLIKGRAPKIHSDGIAFSAEKKMLYYHALTGRHLYGISTKALTEDEGVVAEDDVVNLGKTPPTDGMIMHKKGILFMGNLPKSSVVYRNLNGEIKTLITDKRLSWPDTFTLRGNDLIFSDSRLYTAKPGVVVDDLIFTIYKVALPENLE